MRGSGLRAAADLGTQSGQWGISEAGTTRYDNDDSAGEFNALVALTDPACDSMCRNAKPFDPARPMIRRDFLWQGEGRMGQSLVWITDRGIRRRACSQCEWRYTIPTLLTDPKANEVYDCLASQSDSQRNCEHRS